MNTVNNSRFRQLMEEVKFGHTTTDEAAARIDAYVEEALEKALKDRGILPTPPTAEQRLMRDLHNFGSENA